MGKTRKITMKKEEEDCKPVLNLDSSSSNRIAKITPTKRNNRRPPVEQDTAIKKEEEDREPALVLNGVSNDNTVLPQQVKVEENDEDIDVKSLLKSNQGKQTIISQEQIDDLIDLVAKQGKKIPEASLRVGMSPKTGRKYFNLYNNGPAKRIPSAPTRYFQKTKFCTEEQFTNLIGHINNDKMTVEEASAKVNMPNKYGQFYYDKYLKYANHTIELPRLHQSIMEALKNEFIG